MSLRITRMVPLVFAMAVGMVTDARAACDAGDGDGDVCRVTTCSGNDCVKCLLETTTGTSNSDTDLTVTYLASTSEFKFEGTDESGRSFDCLFDRGTGAGEVHPSDFWVYVYGTPQADDIDVNYYFTGFYASLASDNDRVFGPPDCDNVEIYMGEGNDWVDAVVDEQGSIHLGDDDDTAILSGPASNGGITTYGDDGDDCVLGSAQGPDTFSGGLGTDEFNSRGTWGGSEWANGGNGIDNCYSNPGAWLCESTISFTTCPAYSP